MVYIINIETSTKNCSVSLAENGTTLICKEIADLGYSHAEKLHVFIEEIIKEAAIEFRQINAVCVSKGPGSYTGLRIGVSAAKGICYALNIPLISVDTMLVLAKKVQIDKGLIIPMIDARRMEVYSSIFNSSLEMISPVQAEILDENSYSKYNEPLYFIGDCQEKCKTILTKPNFHFLENVTYPSANEMSEMSFEKYLQNQFEDVAYFEPYYLEDSIIYG
jgi:tRNA threonylcarbamoyladenosine biosynthesis protein TsaB